MTRFLTAIFIVAALVFPASLLWCADTEPTVPMIRTVDPVKAKAGDKVVVEGEALGTARVAELFLTKGDKDLKVEILQQTKTKIQFRVPADMPAGKYGLTVLTAGPLPQILEQPAFLVVQ